MDWAKLRALVRLPSLLLRVCMHADASSRALAECLQYDGR